MSPFGIHCSCLALGLATLGFTSSALAEDALPWETGPAPARPAGEPSTHAEKKKTKVRPRVAQVTPPAPKPVPAPAPAPAAPKPLVAPPAAKPAAPSAPEAETEAEAERQRFQKLEAALRSAGILEPAAIEGRSGERKRALSDELRKLEQQQKSLEDAVAGGVELDSVKAALADVRSRIAQLRAELAALPAAAPAAEAPASPLVLRLRGLETRLARIEQNLSAKTESSGEKAQAPAPAPSAPKSGYDDGFVLRSEDGKFSLQPTGFVQVRFAYEALEGADDRAAFSLPRARAGMKGSVFTKDLKYNFLADFGKGTTQLAYFYGDYTFAKDYAAVRVGLFKRPFSRALVTASEKLEFVSSPLTIKAFGDAHDTGVMLHNGTPKVEYALGVFNGIGSKGGFSGKVRVDPETGAGSVTEGDFSNVPDRFHPTAIARVAYNHNDIQGYSEADLEGGPARFSVGGAGLADFDYDDDDRSFVRGTVDAVLKVEGFSAVTGVVVSSKQDGTTFGDRAYEALGLLAQTGYVIAGRFQPALRYTLISPAEGGTRVHEGAAAFSVYLHKHALKWQNELDVRSSRTGDADTTDLAALTQFQLQF